MTDMSLVDDGDGGTGENPTYAGDCGVEMWYIGGSHRAQGFFQVTELVRCPGSDPDVVGVA